MASPIFDGEGIDSAGPFSFAMAARTQPQSPEPTKTQIPKNVIVVLGSTIDSLENCFGHAVNSLLEWLHRLKSRTSKFINDEAGRAEFRKLLFSFVLDYMGSEEESTTAAYTDRLVLRLNQVSAGIDEDCNDDATFSPYLIDYFCLLLGLVADQDTRGSLKILGQLLCQHGAPFFEGNQVSSLHIIEVLKSVCRKKDPDHFHKMKFWVCTIMWPLVVRFSASSRTKPSSSDALQDQPACEWLSSYCTRPPNMK